MQDDIDGDDSDDGDDGDDGEDDGGADAAGGLYHLQPP